VSILRAGPAQLAAAVDVWRAANAARGLPPSAERTARIREKLAAPDAVVLLSPNPAGDVVGMALAEPGRADDGAGGLVPGYGHVSMVFVHPDEWGRGHGRRLLTALALQETGWSRTTLWTRTSNDRAQRLYAAVGYRPTGRTSTLSDGDGIMQFERVG